jgi:endonuclease
MEITGFAGHWKNTTIQAHLYACVVNNPKSYIHHPSIEKFLYKNSDGTFEFYSEEVHGPNEWVPDIVDDDESDLEELVETTISLERDIEDHLVNNLSAVEEGLKLIGRQVQNDAGRIDIFTKDSSDNPVVIEIKVGEAKDSAIGQIARYLGWYAKTGDRPVRGFLVAGGFPESIQYAAEAIPNLTLLSYKISFSFNEIKI